MQAGIFIMVKKEAEEMVKSNISAVKNPRIAMIDVDRVVAKSS